MFYRNWYMRNKREQFLQKSPRCVTCKEPKKNRFEFEIQKAFSSHLTQLLP